MDRLVALNRDVWLLETTRDVATRFTFDPGDDAIPVWALDGRRLVFQSNRKGRFDLYLKLASGAGPEKLPLESALIKTPEERAVTILLLTATALFCGTGGTIAALEALTAQVGATQTTQLRTPAAGNETKDDEVARVRQAAERGDVEAQFNLAIMYATGDKVAQDFPEAVKWWHRAAEQGHVAARYNLGVAYSNGTGVAQDYAQAVQWYREAAEQGHAGAQTNLGLSYTNGTGVAQDYQEAVRWYRKGAEQGFIGAQFNLGFMYYNGAGVAQDYAQAISWFSKAAEQGLADAQLNVGLMYASGKGVAQDYVEAHKWLSIAAARVSGEVQRQYSEVRDEVATMMTRAQLIEALRRAREWTDTFERRKQ